MSEIEEMEMPTPCKKCGNWFELNDGEESKKWFPNTVICAKCEHEEYKEIEHDEDVEEMIEQLRNAIIDLQQAQKRLGELNHEWEEEPSYLEFFTSHNMELISKFIEHLKSEAEISVPESAILSFFNA